MSGKKRLLVLCVDSDDDLGEKTGLRGPVTGKKQVVEAATRLALADPEDSDANTLFQGARVFDELERGGHDVEIAAITGSVRLGYAADKQIVTQLEKVLSDFRPEACVFVSDGASDEKVIPLVQSRVKIDGVRVVTIKQSKELEKTYFVLLDKLKEPHFARIVFGIPGLALLFFAFSEVLGIRVFVGLLGLYLLIKAAGIEEFLAKKLAFASFSFENVSFVFYFSAVPLVVVALWMGVSAIMAPENAGINSAKAAAVFVKNVLLLLPISFFLIVVGNVLQALGDEKNFLLPKQVVYAGAVLLGWLVLNNAADWIIGSTSFAYFFYSLLLGIAAIYLVIYLSKEFKKGIVSRMSLEGKQVYTEIGVFVGSVNELSKKKESFVIKTPSGQKIDLDFDHISNVGDKIIIRY